MKYLVVCESCLGRGYKAKKLAKKVRLQYQLALAAYQRAIDQSNPPKRPSANTEICSICNGTGLVSTNEKPNVEYSKFPRIAIVGAGIGGVALAVACQHRGIPYTLYERDAAKDDRAQGYGLTLQQANRAIKRLGISSLKQGVISNRHVVHTATGDVIAEWGGRKWVPEGLDEDPKRSNLHIARSAFRNALIEQLHDDNDIKWGYQFVDFTTLNEKFNLVFEVNGNQKVETADIIVGADGIRSGIRERLLGREIKPLQYLGCIVILGICSLKDLNAQYTDLFDGKTVFQTADGVDRIYVMPYSSDAVMWQLSCPVTEAKAKDLSQQGSEALKHYALAKLNWHQPIPDLIFHTDVELITGYPVYDREILTEELAHANKAITLLGDAAHPMSPFKGQGANQALLDALALAQQIYTTYQYAGWSSSDVRKEVLTPFEEEMLARTAVKVKGSAEAVKILHSPFVLDETNQPRGFR